MENFEIVVFLVTMLIALSALSKRIKVPNAAMLVGIGLIIGFTPFLPDLALEPDIIFLTFLPPLLYDAAVRTSWNDFKTSIRPISALAVTLVLFTTTSVAIAAHYFIPGFDWPLAFVLGAIVSPPDAVAATSVTKGLGINRKVVGILEGESLLNDASALIAYRYAVVTVATGSFILWKAGLEFIMITVGGIVVGIILGYLLTWIHKKITDNSIAETSLSLITPFIAYIAAEKLHTSGILAVVTTGLFISRRSSEIFLYQTRLRNRAVWDVVMFLLNGFVFILIGLQLPSILKGLSTYSAQELIVYGLVISGVTIFVRIVWVFTGASYVRIFNRRKLELSHHDDDDSSQMIWKNVMIIAWTGARGIVSLATAIALPLVLQDGSAFPQRNLILFLTFFVIFMTLIIQGFSLPLFIRFLKIRPQKSDIQDNRELQLLITNSILEFIDTDFPIELDKTTREQLKGHYELSAKQLTDEISDLEWNDKHNLPHLLISPNQLLSAELEIASFQRQLLARIHKEGIFSESVVRTLESRLDIEEMRLNSKFKNYGRSET